MTYILLLAALLATSVATVVVVIRTARRRPQGFSNLSAERFGTVSEHWLATHRTER